jgi:tetratricopeptide (TPR) repeat protein
MPNKEKTGHLRVIQGPDGGKQFPVEDRLIFGRAAECGACLADQSTSRQHFRLRVRRGEVEVEDLDSSNGTKVNGRHVMVGALNPGDRVEIGDTVFVYEAPGSRRKVKPGLLVLLLLVVAGAGGYWFITDTQTSKRRAKIDFHLAWAKKFESQKSYRDALLEYQMLAQIAPKAGYQKQTVRIQGMIELQGALGRAGRAAGASDFELAMRILDSLHASLPDDQDVTAAWNQLRAGQQGYAVLAHARELYGAKKFDEAVAFLDSVARLAPDPALTVEAAVALVKKGYDQWNSGRTVAAQQAFEQALVRAPGNQEATQAFEQLKATKAAAPAPKPKPAPRPKPRPEPNPEVVAETSKAKTESTAAPAAPPSAPAISAETKAEAEKVYWEGYGAMKDNFDTTAAVVKFFEVRELVPDPRFEFYQKATDWLKRLGKL